MSLVNNFKNVTDNMQQGAKNASITFTQILLRLVTGFYIGLILSLIIQEFAQSGTLTLVFFTTLFAMLLYRMLRTWSIFQIFIFNTICILIAISLRMYIMLAP